jgi:hypothetical protein
MSTPGGALFSRTDLAGLICVRAHDLGRRTACREQLAQQLVGGAIVLAAIFLAQTARALQMS